ncbi:alpha/beta hydrolase [bacterium]|nr:alpha/beta hydrolase [bacterium]
MLFMVTSRRKKGDKYGDEEQPRFGYDYLYDYNGGSRGNDGFAKTGRRGFEATLLKELLRLRDDVKINTPKVGVYLHGYNNDWQDSIDEIFDLEKVLAQAIGYAPVLVGFSWPSKGKTKDYLTDREEVRDSVGAFTHFLRDINQFLVRHERDCFSTSYCIAHSMGNYLLRKGAEYLSDHLGDPVGRMMFNETVMLAPDLASGDIENDGKGVYISQFSRRVHVYYSRHDRALKASSVKRFGADRLGRHGADDYENLPPNVVIVNGEKYANSESVDEEKLRDREGKDVSVHSSHRYHPKIIADIVHVLSSIDRALIPTREEAPKTDSTSFKQNHYVLI